MNIIYLFVFLTPCIFYIMNIFYNLNEKKKLKQYLLKCGVLEKKILQSIFTENKNKDFALTKGHQITKQLLDLRIVFQVKTNEKNNKQIICRLNLDVLKLIFNDAYFKKIYL